MIGWMRGLFASRPSANDRYRRAVELTDELTETMRERSASPDPFRALLADMFLQHHNIPLVADAYEASQESRIHEGPPKP